MISDSAAQNESIFQHFVTAEIIQPRQKTLSSIVASQIANEIFYQELQPGAPLPVESKMMEIFDVSRGTLREALRVLQTQGLVQMQTGRGGGPIVARPNPRALSDALTLNFRAMRVTFDEVLATRSTIEPTLAQLAAINRNEEDIQRLRNVVDKLEVTQGRESASYTANRDFHQAVAVASHNRPLAVMWTTISTVADGQGLGANMDECMWAAGHAAHNKILEAIEASNPEAAFSAMSVHLNAFHQLLAETHPHALSSPIEVIS